MSGSARPASVTLGLEQCLSDPPPVLKTGRFGLLMNQASVDARFRHACDLFDALFSGRLAALFSPQHGLWSADQDNMIETPHGRHPRLGIPIYSLYAEHRKPTPSMLEGLDCLLVDLQDVGTRVYTYVWTISLCLEACAEAGVPVIVLDRPNPLGGQIVEGPRLRPEFTSFIGRAPVPMRHGLTVGEMTLFLNHCMGTRADIEVVPMRGWRRDMSFAETGRCWMPPSPNLPRLEGAQVYPGAVLLEGTELSEGRGTTTPFEVIGAPYIDPFALKEALDEWALPGILFRPVTFKPTFQKWQGTDCGGVFLHTTDPTTARPYRAIVALLSCIRRLRPDAFRWLSPPYEYEREKMPIDILSGSDELRTAVDRGLTEADLQRVTAVDETNWWQDVEPFLLYGV